MTYALFRHARGIAGAVGDPSGRRIRGRYRRIRRTYGANRAASYLGIGVGQRPRRTVAGNGAAEYERMGRAYPIPSRNFWRTRRSAGENGIREGRRAAGRPGRQPVSVNGRGERFFIFVRWTARYAHEPSHGH